MKSIPFGQYVPVESPVHRLESRAKMGLVAAYTTLLFSTGSFWGLALAAVFTAVGIAIAHVPLRLALRGLKAISFLLVFTLAAHALRWNPATVTLFRLGPLGIDGPGLVTGTFFASRVVLLVAGTSLLTLTTSPVELTDGLERLMRPLGHIGIPVGELAMMLTIALRFIPTTAEEAEKIVMAQSARGARFDSGGPVTRARAYIPVLVPLFVGLFRRADELATAMEARCYHGGPDRTRLRISTLTLTDWSVMVIIGGSLIAFGVWL